MVGKGSIFLYFGYRLKVNVMNAQLIEWMISKLRDKFHVHLKVVQCVWNLWYYIICCCYFVLKHLQHLLWRKRDNMGITWVVWNHLTMRKCFGGADFCYCKICVHIHICGYLLSNISLRRVWHIGRKWLRHRGGNYLMELFLLKIPCSSCTQHLVVSWDMWLMLDLRGFWILLKHNHCYVSPQ